MKSFQVPEGQHIYRKLSHTTQSPSGAKYKFEKQKRGNISKMKYSPYYYFKIIK